MVEIAKNLHEVLAMLLKELRKKLFPVKEFCIRELTLEFGRKKTRDRGGEEEWKAVEMPTLTE